MAKSKNTNNGTRDLMILLGVIAIGIAIYSAVQITLTNTNDSGFTSMSSQVSFKQFNEKVSNEENFILLYGDETSPESLAYKPILAQSIKDSNSDVTLYYVDTSSYSDKDKAAIDSYLGNLTAPATVMFIEGKMVDELEGIQEADAVDDFVKEFDDYIE